MRALLRRREQRRDVAVRIGGADDVFQCIHSAKEPPGFPDGSPHSITRAGQGRCDAAAMQNSIGIESMVLMRLNMPAVLADAAFASAERSGYLLSMFSAFCWFGQMMNHTLNHMIVPSHMPMPISRYVTVEHAPPVSTMSSV